MTVSEAPVSEATVSAEGSGRPLLAFRNVAREFERQILAGELSIGEALPSETQLAQRFGVSRSTIREAIRLLEQLGLIRRDEGRNKLRITVPQVNEIGARMKTAFLLRDTTFEQLWEVLRAIEPICAASAARRATETDLALIADNISRTEQALHDWDALAELDIEFHNLVAAATRNEAFHMSRTTVGELFYPAFTQVMRRLNAGERLLYAHRKIHEAIRAGDEREAQQWTERHIGDFHRACDLANLDFTAHISATMPAVQ